MCQHGRKLHSCLVVLRGKQAMATNNANKQAPHSKPAAYGMLAGVDTCPVTDIPERSFSEEMAMVTKL